MEPLFAEATSLLRSCFRQDFFSTRSRSRCGGGAGTRVMVHVDCSEFREARELRRRAVASVKPTRSNTRRVYHQARLRVTRSAIALCGQRMSGEVESGSPTRTCVN